MKKFNFETVKTTNIQGLHLMIESLKNLNNNLIFFIDILENR